MIEATLQSKSVMGNIDDDEADDHRRAEKEPKAATTEDEHQLGEATLMASFQVDLECIKVFVRSRQLFLDVPCKQAECGLLHVSSALERALKSWAMEAGGSIKVHKQANESRAVCVVGHNRHLSLVSFKLLISGWEQETARFIHWQVVKQTGRPVELDSQSRVKALVCVGALREALPLSDAYIIHPDVGVGMLRARGYRFQERPQMPPDMRRLQSMCDHALMQQSLLDSSSNRDVAEGFTYNDADSTSSSCLLCCFRADQSSNCPFPGHLGTGAPFRCPLCLQCFG